MNDHAYTHYAALYDTIGQTAFTERLAVNVLHWLVPHRWSRASLPQRRVLDLACGTGAATLVFAQAGCQVVGLDRSAAMLEYAHQKFRDGYDNVSLLHEDIRNLGPRLPFNPHSFDLVTCFFDSLNYLLDDSDLQRVCQGVATLLQPGGLFIFDLNTEAEFCTWDECDQVVYDGSEHLVYNRLHYDAGTGIATGRIVWFRYNNQQWWRGEETHTQRCWSDAEIEAALAATGRNGTGELHLHLIARRTPTWEDAPEDAPRVVYCIQAE